MGGEGEIVADTSAKGEHPTTARLLFRFAVGSVHLGTERLASALRAFDEDRRTAAPGATSIEIPQARHVVIGALVCGSARLSSALTGARTKLADAAPARALRRLARAPGAGLLAGRYQRARARAERVLQRWAELGLGEEREGVPLARTAFAEAMQATVAHIADSPDLSRVIADQSESLASKAVGSLRERSARADNLAEGAARRLFRRRRDGERSGES